jgi:hypothetical protein
VKGADYKEKRRRRGEDHFYIELLWGIWGVGVSYTLREMTCARRERTFLCVCRVKKLKGGGGGDYNSLFNRRVKTILEYY